ncbi:hypothetical protein [Myxococcus qinghaiensis]|uniref:hypothetical protein n=1 Tax=Myxococcus qinghaiensis TaxID=2906758 RepID=UPI0020A76DC1|nr:hypothetical protein [Myxococcus qinghaiensis]MCP3166698.1 hypothetical protein [Myxococcus qinghaiensis]
MRKHTLLVAVLALPFLAGAEQTRSDEALEQLGSEEDTSTEARPIPPLPPYCWDLDLTACTSTGATRICTDGIWSDYVCTCRLYTGPGGTQRVWDCPEVR